MANLRQSSLEFLQGDRNSVTLNNNTVINNAAGSSLPKSIIIRVSQVYTGTGLIILYARTSQHTCGALYSSAVPRGKGDHLHWISLSKQFTLLHWKFCPLYRTMWSLQSLVFSSEKAKENSVLFAVGLISSSSGCSWQTAKRLAWHKHTCL